MSMCVSGNVAWQDSSGERGKRANRATVSASHVSLTTAPLGAGGCDLRTTAGARSTSEIQGAELQTALTFAAHTHTHTEKGLNHTQSQSPSQYAEQQPVRIFEFELHFQQIPPILQ